jgi:uncharacterized protein YbbC (DUF1343 family)
MSDKLTFYKLFNKNAEDFCKELVSTFPEVAEFKQLKTALLLVKNLDERKPKQFFEKFLTSDIRSRIVSHDETFFMTQVHEQKHLVQNIDGFDESQWDSIVDMLRSLWQGLGDDNKEAIWKYFQVLIALSDKCT